MTPKASYTPEEMVRVLQDVFFVGEMTGFLDSISMHPDIPPNVRQYAATKVQELRSLAGVGGGAQGD
jgi:hypothetical protein